VFHAVVVQEGAAGFDDVIVTDDTFDGGLVKFIDGIMEYTRGE